MDIQAPDTDIINSLPAVLSTPVLSLGNLQHSLLEEISGGSIFHGLRKGHNIYEHACGCHNSRETCRTQTRPFLQGRYHLIENVITLNCFSQKEG